MNIFVYGDESGVFDKAHNDVFAFGGLVFLDRESRDVAIRKYIHAERAISAQYGDAELKASVLSPKHKSGLFRSMNGLIRYAFLVDQQRVIDEIFGNKKSKQRFLDYVFKVGLKKVLVRLIQAGRIDPGEVGGVYVRFDEHSTATDGRYELKEGMEEEFKRGTFNYRYNVFHKPIFPEMRGAVELEFRNSEKDALIRASDIIANRAWYYESTGKGHALGGSMMVVRFP